MDSIERKRHKYCVDSIHAVRRMGKTLARKGVFTNDKGERIYFEFGG